MECEYTGTSISISISIAGGERCGDDGFLRFSNFQGFKGIFDGGRGQLDRRKEGKRERRKEGKNDLGRLICGVDIDADAGAGIKSGIREYGNTGIREYDSWEYDSVGIVRKGSSIEITLGVEGNRKDKEGKRD